MTCWPRPAGRRGSSSIVPLDRPADLGQDPGPGPRLASRLEEDHPELVVSNMPRRCGKDKVLIDWSQNHPAKTTVAAYSLRARPEPTVSTPVSWDEVEACAASGDPG